MRFSLSFSVSTFRRSMGENGLRGSTNRRTSGAAYTYAIRVGADVTAVDMAPVDSATAAATNRASKGGEGEGEGELRVRVGVTGGNSNGNGRGRQGRRKACAQEGKGQAANGGE